jgi:hypothetical protein
MVEWYWQEETEESAEELIPVLLCAPQIQHGLTRAQTPASALGGLRWRPEPWRGQHSLWLYNVSKDILAVKTCHLYIQILSRVQFKILVVSVISKIETLVSEHSHFVNINKSLFKLSVKLHRYFSLYLTSLFFTDGFLSWIFSVPQGDFRDSTLNYAF